MGLTGIIAEFNPLHNGHKKLIDFAKRSGDNVACVISGNFVQRGDVSIFSKQKRAELALLCGADIVVEMPVLWSMSTAQNFALCGVFELYALGCSKILFGSECGDIDTLNECAKVLLSEDFSKKVGEHLKEGVTFAAARDKAAEELGTKPGILDKPNNNLGTEYIIAAKKLGIDIEFETVKRLGENHDSLNAAPNYVSSSFIREKILAGDIAYAERFMPLEVKGILNQDMIANIAYGERAILGILRTKRQEEFKNLPDLSEGLENKLYFSVRVAPTLDELYNMVKSKRYTLSRIRRLVLGAALGFCGDFFMKTPPYIRVLGLSELGEEHIKRLKSNTPVIMRVTNIKKLGRDALTVFETECRATDIYALCFKTALECGLEYKYKLLKHRCEK